MSIFRIEGRRIAIVVLSVVISFAFVAIAVNGATTISTNIVTGGTLSVTGATSITGATVIGGDISVSGGDVNIGTGSATTTLTVSGGYLGIASSTPWGGLSIEAEDLSGDAPMFVIGDQGTSTPFIIVDGNTGTVGMATTSSQENLNVGGDASFGSSATTTITIDSTTAETGGCIQIRGTDDVLYRAYISATSTASDGMAAVWFIDAGLCQ